MRSRAHAGPVGAVDRSAVTALTSSVANASASATPGRTDPSDDHRLTKSGVIKGFRVDINQAALGRTLEAVIDARMAHTQGFDDALMKRDDVLWAAHVTGESDVTLAVACDGTAGLDAFLRWLQREGATETRTDVVLNKIR